MDRIRIYADTCENMFAAFIENGLPAMGLLISKRASSGTLAGDMELLGDDGLATALSGQETAMAMLRLDGLCFAEISEDGIKRMRALSDEEEAYVNPRQ